jgi:hypothetical protein
MEQDTRTPMIQAREDNRTPNYNVRQRGRKNGPIPEDLKRGQISGRLTAYATKE